MTTFRKSEQCPSSQDLLNYLAGRIAGKAARTIGNHLQACEFCSAEVTFYSRYPQEDESEAETTASEMPPHLFELAEALLSVNGGNQKVDKIKLKFEKIVFNK
ncbi:MAG TPA: hypothetical protein VNK26_08465 [Pyrinomonadaceae bacterium]|nr:hypothetical protein [Pyrinomonadaceae bacterium]